MKKIFICYSHKDEEKKEEIHKHLSVYGSDIDIWNDRRIEASENWKEEIIKSLNDCQAAILIISTDFLLSKFIQEIELPTLLQKREEEEIKIFPFIVKPCNWQDILPYVSEIQARPKDAKPLSSFKGHKKEEILVNFAKEIKNVITKEKKPEPASESNTPVIIKKSGLSVTDSIYEAFNSIYGDLNVIPASFFSRIDFLDYNNYYTSINNFTLESNNPKINEFFNSFDLDENGNILNTTTSKKSKIEFIINKLFNNNITSFNNKIENKSKTLNIVRNLENNYYEKFDKFKFTESFLSIPNENELTNLTDYLRLGYYHYRIGNLLESINIFKKAKIVAQNEGNQLKEFICLYNLKNLGHLLKFRYDNEYYIKANELAEIDLKMSFKNHFDNEIAEYILSNNFINEPKLKISRIKNDIIENYHSFLRGGVSSNSYIYGIIYQYSVLHAFLNKNYIIYDIYLNYQEIVETVFESLIAGYSIKNNPSVDTIDYYSLNHILEYSEVSKIEKIFLRYNIYEISFDPNDGEEYNFITLFENFINTRSNDLQNYFQEKNKEFKYQFYNRNNKLFQNFLCLLTYLDISKEVVLSITDLLIKHIKSNQEINHNHYNYIFKFINRKRKFIKNNQFSLILHHYLTQQNNHNSSYFNVLASNLRFKKFELKLSESEIITITQQALKNNVLLLIQLFSIINKECQPIIFDLITTNLKSNFKLFYYSVIYGIINYDSGSYLKNYIDDIDINKMKNSNMSAFQLLRNEPKHFQIIDETFNLYLKYKLELDIYNFIKCKDISEYYLWLFDINNFDYSKFNPYWIDIYLTDYYREYFRKSKSLKKKLKEYIMKSNDNRILKVYNQIYLDKQIN